MRESSHLFPSISHPPLRRLWISLKRFEFFIDDSICNLLGQRERERESILYLLLWLACMLSRFFFHFSGLCLSSSFFLFFCEWNHLCEWALDFMKNAESPWIFWVSSSRWLVVCFWQFGWFLRQTEILAAFFHYEISMSSSPQPVLSLKMFSESKYVLERGLVGNDLSKHQKKVRKESNSKKKRDCIFLS